MNWEKRIVKSINSMCTELSLPLARKVNYPKDSMRQNSVLFSAKLNMLRNGQKLA